MEWRFLGRTFYLPKAFLILLAVGICVGLAVGGYFMLEKDAAFQEDVTYITATASNGAQSDATAPAVTQTPEGVYWEIYIVGAVQHPGIYALAEGALAYNAIEAAGGLLPSVDPETVNMVQELQDHLMIHILTEEERVEQARDSSLVLTKNGSELQGGPESPGNDGDKAEKININSATKEALMTLPGIGEAKAESILAYRQENGPFQTIEDIMLVSGIKESAFARIKDRITT